MEMFLILKDILGKNLTPKFDSQAAVYKSIQDLLDSDIKSSEDHNNTRRQRYLLWGECKMDKISLFS
jgi:hypothetical protein